MANIPVYGCTRCQRIKPRDELVVKKALFTGMGAGAETVRARVVAWLCKDCLKIDEDFLREKFHPPRLESELGHAS